MENHWVAQPKGDEESWTYDFHNLKGIDITSDSCQFELGFETNLF